MVKTALEKAREAPKSTKGRILAAAEAIFAAKGFPGASTREIAARAGVNISSLHYHWESKETLYFAVVQNIYDQIVALLRHTLAPLVTRHREPGPIVDVVMRALLDFFTDNPNVPKLLMRRIVENEADDIGVEREILMPAWTVFSQWLARLGRRRFSEAESRLFILSIQTVVLVYLLDSASYRMLLGGSVRKQPLRDQVRDHLTRLVHQLLA